MNRRSFLETLTKAAAGFSILPAATTYSRVWRAQRGPLKLVPFWMQTRFNMVCYDEGYVNAMKEMDLPSLTRASITPMTPEMFEAQGFKEVKMGDIFGVIYG